MLPKINTKTTDVRHHESISVLWAHFRFIRLHSGKPSDANCNQESLRSRMQVQGKIVGIACSIGTLQRGHLGSCSAHATHSAKCVQGSKTTLRTACMQMQHAFCASISSLRAQHASYLGCHGDVLKISMTKMFASEKNDAQHARTN